MLWCAGNRNDADLIPTNIKDGVDVFGVEWDYEWLWNDWEITYITDWKRYDAFWGSSGWIITSINAEYIVDTKFWIIFISDKYSHLYWGNFQMNNISKTWWLTMNWHTFQEVNSVYKESDNIIHINWQYYSSWWIASHRDYNPETKILGARANWHVTTWTEITTWWTSKDADNWLTYSLYVVATSWTAEASYFLCKIEIT